jgi:SsrA-binding protein
LSHEIEAKGYTLLPLSLYFKAGKLKVELGLAKGKNVHDKRQTALKRDATREMDRARKLSQ